MKQQMKRLKGTNVLTSIGQINLKQYGRIQTSEYDQLYFSTAAQQFLLCKIYNLQNQNSSQRYQKEKEIYAMSETYPSLAKCITRTEFNYRKINYGLIVLDKISKNSSISEICNSLSFFELLNMTKSVLELLKQLKQRNEVYLNLKPQNIYMDADKNFVIISPQYVCQKGNHSAVSQINQVFFGNIQKYFKYCSPEVLDNYTYFPIDIKSDVFSLGCILYEIIYGKYPFQSKFANINIIYESQQGFFGKFIEKIFKPYKERMDVQELMSIIDEELKKNPSEPKQQNSSSTNQSSSKSTTAKNSHSIFDDISSVFNKYTKQSQGAYLNYTQDNQSFPQSKHLSFILNKLYKNPNKVQKLQSIILKHIKSTQIGKKKNFIIKNILLVLQILRKNRNYMIPKWRQIILQIKNTLQQSDQLIQLCNLLIKKIQLIQQLNCILRGNFYLQDVCQFKLLTLQNLYNMIRYLEIVLVFAGKLLLYKQDNYLYQYVLEIVCDEIYDLISMVIMSAICIRKDNQLGFRKDNMADMAPVQKSLKVLLKRINNLSNSISFHSIYSIEPDYYSYKQDIYLSQNPQYTSFEYFTKYCRSYKGLGLPENNMFSQNINQNIEFSSFEKVQKDNVKQSNKKFFYGNQMMNSDQDDQPASSVNVVVQEKQKNSASNPFYEPHLAQKSFNNSNSSKASGSSNLASQKKNLDMNNLFGNNLFQQQTLKKTKSSEGNFNVDNIAKKTGQQTTKIPVKKIGFDDFNNFFAGMMPPKPEKKQSQPAQNNQKPQNKPGDMFQNFSFFQEQHLNKNDSKKLEQKQQKRKDVFNLLNLDQSPKKSQKPVIKVDHQALNADIFNYQWLKKTQKGQTPIMQLVANKQKIFDAPKPQPQKLSPFITQIINSLKLKQLKDLILVNRQVVIQFQKLVFQKVIGSGSAGQVYLGKYNQQQIAIKKVKTKENPNALKQFQRQLVTYIKIKKNQFLVSLVGLSKSGQDFYLMTEFCNGGSLFDLLHKKAGQIHLTWKNKMSLILQIARGMKALHQMRPAIIHRDLKSLNVFILLQNNQWIAKVADFGLSRSPESQMMTMALGTLHWMAPELLDNKQYSLKVDVYSFAIVMWQVCARKTPYFELSNPMAIMKYVTIQKKRPNMNIIDVNCPPKLLQLIQRCWDQQPDKRPYFPQILETLTQIQKSVPQ